MRIETTAEPVYSPILLDELKDHLRIDGAGEDASLGAFITSSVALVERWLGGALINRSVDIYLDAWPSMGTAQVQTDPWWNGVADGAMPHLTQERLHVSLPIKPVSSIAAIRVKDATGTEILWNSDNYYLKPGLTPAVVRKYGRLWPVPGVPAEGIRISAIAGFGADWNAVPAGIRQAVLMLAAHLYYNRGDTPTEPALKASGAHSLLMPFREQRL